MDQWAIWIDIEGFSQLYLRDPYKAQGLIGKLMKGIWVVGNTVCSGDSQRIWAYQTGDGFLLSSSFGQGSPHMPMGISIFLLRTLVLAEGCGKCAVSIGDMADVQSTFPQEIEDNMDECGRVRIGGGLMITFPVMGTALVNAHRLSNKERGSVLIWDAALPLEGNDGVRIVKEEQDYKVLDWVHTQNDYASQLLQYSKDDGSTETIESRLREYLKGESPSKEWLENTYRYNGLALS